ncbi:substrate-binding periplasmic protein [Terasakiella pusilla]|uniref:substrate-binding periplasmic protein n=1 Tax=Terasakiella pusilla TaxID=64973 RepID=UPI00048AE409|nr:ABC transporter substrate-binding protein [Terasakiella pusilla]
MFKFLSALIIGAFVCLPSPSHAKDRLKDLKTLDEMKVCIWPDYFAISYRNPRTGKLEGIDIDMAYELAKYLEVEVEFVDSSFAELKDNMQNGRCDIAMHGVGVREDRKAYMDFAEPHLVSGIYAVGMKRNEAIQKWSDIDQPGNVVVVQKGTYMEPVMREYLKHAELSVVESFKAREQEVESGRADVFMTDYPYGKRMASLTTWAHLMEPDEVLAPTPYAFAVPKGDTEWLAIINKFVRYVKESGRLAAAAERHGLTPIVAK